MLRLRCVIGYPHSATAGFLSHTSPVKKSANKSKGTWDPSVPLLHSQQHVSMHVAVSSRSLQSLMDGLKGLVSNLKKQ